MNVIKVLQNIQQELKAPKGQYNGFGKYNYRSCEDILEAVKPLLAKYDAVLTLSDEMVPIGDRIYVKATAELSAIQGTEITTKIATAYAREDESKKGMDGSQVTGAASSYARKYALNGLFCIDDTKDADTQEQRAEQTARAQQTQRKATRQEIHNPTAADVARIAQEAAQQLGGGDEYRQRVAAAFERQNDNWKAKTLENFHIKSIAEADQRQLDNLFNFFQLKGVAV